MGELGVNPAERGRSETSKMGPKEAVLCTVDVESGRLYRGEPVRSHNERRGARLETESRHLDLDRAEHRSTSVGSTPVRIIRAVPIFDP